MVQAQLVSLSPDGRTAVVNAGLYDASNPSQPPRLCMTSRVRMGLATDDAAVERILGDRFVQPVAKAMQQLQQAKQRIMQQPAQVPSAHPPSKL